MATDKNGNTDLMQAVLTRNIPEIIRLLELLTKEEKEAVNNEGYTALMLATMYGYLEEMQALIDGGVDIETTDERQYTALHIGAEQDMAKAIEKLRENGANIRAQNEFSHTAIMLAAELNHASAIDALIDLEREEDADVIEVTDGRGYTAIMLATEQNHPETIRVLRNNGANVDAVDNRGYTSAMIAAKKNNAEAIRALTEDMSTEEEEDLGADLEATDDEGYNAVMIAAKYNNIKALQALIDNSADIDTRTIDEDGGITAVIIALQKNNTEAAELLIRRGASMEASHDGLTPLMCASANGNIRIMKLLKARNVDLNALSGGGETAISAAIENEQMEAIQWLAANGAKVSEVYEDEDLDKIIVANQPIFYLLNTAEITDKIFAKKKLIEEEKDFISSDEFNEHIAAERFIALCIINATGVRLSQQIASANRLFQDNFESWFSLMEEKANLSAAINQLIADGLSQRHQQIISNLFRISESSYEDAVGESYEKMDQVYIILPLRDSYLEEIEVSRKRSGDALVRIGKTSRRIEEDDESELSIEIDEDNVSDGEEGDDELSGGKSENAAGDTVASETSAGGNTQAAQQGSTSLSMLSDEQEKVEKQIVIVETKVEDNAELNTWIETIFAGWGYMPQWMQDNIINSSPVQTILKSLAEKEAIYNPQSIEDKFAEIFVIEKRDDESESTQDNSNEKATSAKVPLELVDTSFMSIAFKVGICILPMVAGSGMLGEFPVLGQFGVEVI